MWTPLTIMSAPVDESGRIDVSMYAMGWAIRPIFGNRQIVTHTGGLTGMTTIIMMFPEQDFGVLVLSNSGNGGAMRSAARGIAANYLGVEIPDPVAEMSRAAGEGRDKALAEMKAAWDGRAKDSRPSLPLEDYARVYRDAWYGPITISVEKGRLRISMDRSPSLKGALRHFQYDTFVAEWDDRSAMADAYVTFHLNEKGAVEGFRMKKFDPRTDFSFDFQHLDPRAE